MKIAALSDIHIKETSQGQYTSLFEQISSNADILVVGGDLCDLGLPSEAEILAQELKHLKIPIVGVLGNHDYQSGKEDKVKSILTEAGMHILETEPFEYEGVGFAGVKGFGGGFDQFALGSFGEKIYKDLVQETINESLALENQLKQLETQKKFVVMHYSPIKETLKGESPEIFPYLGSSRFLVPIESFKVDAVFHGHAHHGTHKGMTPTQIPVYNVASLIMQKENPRQPFFLLEA